LGKQIVKNIKRVILSQTKRRIIFIIKKESGKFEVKFLKYIVIERRKKNV